MFWNSNDDRLEALEERVDRLETQMAGLEKSFRRELDSLGRYGRQTRDELIQAQGKLEGIVSTLASMVSHAENEQGTAEAKALLRRARNNLTRVVRHLQAVPA